MAPASAARTVTTMSATHTLTARDVADTPRWDCSCGDGFTDPAAAARHATS